MYYVGKYKNQSKNRQRNKPRDSPSWGKQSLDLLQEVKHCKVLNSTQVGTRGNVEKIIYTSRKMTIHSCTIFYTFLKIYNISIYPKDRLIVVHSRRGCDLAVLRWLCDD